MSKSEEDWALPGRWQSFHGQMLINWFVSAFAEDHYIRQSLKTTELRILAVQFCTHLLAAGVLRQLPDKDAPQCEALFRPDLIYFWSHTEAVNVAPPTPGRLPSAAWPPPLSPSMLQDIELHYNGNPASTGVDPKQIDKEKHLITELSRKVQQQKHLIEELQGKIEKMVQEKERSKTLADIQSLVEGVKADFESPTKEKSLKSDDPVSVSTQNGHHYNNNAATSRLESKIISPSNLEGKFKSVLITEVIETDKSGAEQCLTVSPSSISITLSPQSSPQSVKPSLEPSSNPYSTCTSPAENGLHKSVVPGKDGSTNQEEKSQNEKSHVKTVSDSKPLSPTPSSQTSDPTVLMAAKSISDSSSHSPVNIAPPPPPPPPPCPLFEGEPSPLISAPRPPPPPPMMGMISHTPLPPPLAGMSLQSVPGSCPPPPIPVKPPPPPPIPGMAPPPPPIPGIVPPPPPIPGNGHPVCAPGPPPPPLSAGVPPPPSPGGMNPPPSPAPFPSPPVGGWNAQRALFRKQPLNPKIPMKPLYWTRVIVPPTITKTVADTEIQTPQNQSVPLWGELEEVKVENLDEFAALFSRQVIDKKNTKKKVVKETKAQVIKILDSKRSQNVGILSQSLHVDFSEIENAIYNFDTSTVSLEALQRIYDVRASEEELSLLQAHMTSGSDQPLDKPEQFLLELADIPHFAERIACFMFQTEFSDNISGISSKLNNIKSTCQLLMSSENLKTILGIILALGNYMNGGNMQRGQADGFGLEILAKLKDVKSKDNSMTLLHFIVVSYMKKCGDVEVIEAKLPVPEPSDIEKASTVQFEDIEAQLNELDKELNGCQKKMETVISKSLEENVQPFKEKMESFLSTAKKQLIEEFENCEECKRKFYATLKFYQFQPKGGIKEEEVAPKDFFPLWTPFCSDFKDLWQKEQQRIIKEKLKEAKKKQDERKQEIKKGKRHAGGLKSQLRLLEGRLTNT